MNSYTAQNQASYVLEEFFYNIWEYLEEKDKRNFALGMKIEKIPN
jgi:hypothetical protein